MISASTEQLIAEQWAASIPREVAFSSWKPLDQKAQQIAAWEMQPPPAYRKDTRSGRPHGKAWRRKSAA